MLTLSNALVEMSVDEIWRERSGWKLYVLTGKLGAGSLIRNYEKQMAEGDTEKVLSNECNNMGKKKYDSEMRLL